MSDHVRSAVHYTFCHDARKRSDTGLLHSGHALRMHAALAGLSPDENCLQHIRTTAEVQHVVPLSDAGALVIDYSCGAHRTYSQACTSVTVFPSCFVLEAPRAAQPPACTHACMHA
jgi:hypothetical protein